MSGQPSVRHHSTAEPIGRNTSVSRHDKARYSQEPLLELTDDDKKVSLGEDHQSHMCMYVYVYVYVCVCVCVYVYLYMCLMWRMLSYLVPFIIIMTEITELGIFLHRHVLIMSKYL